MIAAQKQRERLEDEAISRLNIRHRITESPPSIIQPVRIIREYLQNSDSEEEPSKRNIQIIITLPLFRTKLNTSSSLISSGVLS